GVDPFSTNTGTNTNGAGANANATSTSSSSGASRAAILFSTNDLLGALERDRFGTWKFDCEPDGESQREMAFRLATNIMMYATCLDYKADQVHIPFIMNKKRH